MANHKSAKKRIIRNANRALINGARVSRIRTFVKKVDAAIAAGDADAAREALRAAQPELQRGVSRGVLHKTPCHARFHVWQRGSKPSPPRGCCPFDLLLVLLGAGMPPSATILSPTCCYPHFTHSPNQGYGFLFMHHIWPVAVALRRVLSGAG